MRRSRVTLGQTLFAVLVISLLFGFLSCSKKEPTAPAKAEASQSSVAAAETSLIPPEAVSEVATGTLNSKLVLPVSFERRTGDLDVMLKQRTIRALVVVNPISFFYDRGKPRGMAFEALSEFERYVNKKYKTRALKVNVTLIPMRPDQLAPALADGIGDFIAMGVVITPEREQQFSFTVPTMRNFSRIVVTGDELASATTFDDLVGKDIYVNPISADYQRLQQISTDRQKAGKPPLSIKPADKSLLEDDLIEMVNADLIPATSTSDPRAKLWSQVLPNIKPHSQMLISSGVNLAWVARKSNPELLKLLNEFVGSHGQGTSFGNTLALRYLQNTKWIKNSTSPDEIKKFSQYVQYFKKYAGEYNFDYLMIAAQGYQESLLDLSMANY